VRHLGDLLYSYLLSLLFCDQFPLIFINGVDLLEEVRKSKVKDNKVVKAVEEMK